MRMQRVVLVGIAAITAGGCAIRLGGAKPESYTVVAAVTQEADARAVANRLRGADADLVLLSAPRDSAWFAQVGQVAGLPLSGPGHTAPNGLALYSEIKVLGDTALALSLQGGGKLHMQDALFEIGKERHLDMMLVQFENGTPIREGVRRLLEYYATDVGGTAAVLLAVSTPTTAGADSVALLLRSAFGNALECDPKAPTPGSAAGTLRLFYGPAARMECKRGGVLPGEAPAITARVVVGR